jgi:glycosyltransferase involved in cell wall biosynthesis
MQRVKRKKHFIIVVMPAYNAEKTLEITCKAIPKNIIDKVLVIDDASNDKTITIAKKLKLEVIEHKRNLGYGGNQKTCYKTALKKKADIIIMLHPDYQYDPKLIPLLIQPIKKRYFDIMLGSRMQSRKSALDGGMPVYKYIFNRILTFIENISLGLHLSEYHTGYRAYTREVLEKIPFETFSDDFIFDQQLLIAAHSKRFRIGEIAVPTKYFPEASSINFKKSIQYGLATLYEIGKYIFYSQK